MTRPASLCRRLLEAPGAELIEFALVLPILLLVFAGIIDFALGFQRYLVVANAAREGARMASLPGYGTTDIQNRVTVYLQQGTGVPTLVPTVTSCLASIPVGTGQNVSAARVVVQTNYAFPFLGPVVQLVTGGTFGSMNIGARSTMRVEATSSLPACTGP